MFRLSRRTFVRTQLIGFIVFASFTVLGLIEQWGPGILIPGLFAIAFLISWLIRRQRPTETPPED